MPRCAVLLPLALTALCSLTGCAGRADAPPPLVLAAASCPEPAAPALPPVDGGASFDTPAQYDIFMTRDDLLRGHINALRRALACYRAQTLTAAAPR